MQSVRNLPLVSGDLDLVCAGADGWREQVDRAIAAGRCRPEWCFALRGAGGSRAAAVTYWAPSPGAEPVRMWHLDIADDPGIGADLLRRTLPGLGARRISWDITLPVGVRPEISRAAEHSALLRGGFTLELERLELRWSAGSPVPTESGRLTWRPAADYPDTAVLAMVRHIADGTLDHDTRMELEAGHGDADAREAYDYYRGRPGSFLVAHRDGDPVGVVVASRVSDALGMLDFAGVLPEHRGNGYVHDLVAHGTALLAGEFEAVIAGTDLGNTPMAAAFTRAGYLETERVYRYYWRT